MPRLCALCLLKLVLSLVLVTSAPVDVFSMFPTRNVGELEEENIESRIIKAIFKRYDWRIRPKGLNASVVKRGRGPVVVMTNLYLRTISKIDDVNMEYSTQFTFREMWNDARLAYGRSLDWAPTDPAPAFILLVPDDQKQRIWMPDTFFQNEKNAQRHKIDKPNVLMRVYSNGDILYSVRLSLTLSCPMSLRQYPMDRQTCVIDLASFARVDVFLENLNFKSSLQQLKTNRRAVLLLYAEECTQVLNHVISHAYTTDDIVYQWKNDSPIQLKDTVKSSLPSFDLVGHGTGYCTSKTATGEYSCLRVELHFQRMFSYYLLQLYIPSFMLVIVSWVSFWVDKSSVPARVTLGVTTLLTITTQASGINSKLPPVSYTKAIDVWIGVCLAFVFGALLEYALVNYAGNEISRKKSKIKSAELHSCTRHDRDVTRMAQQGAGPQSPTRIIPTKFDVTGPVSPTNSLEFAKCPSMSSFVGSCHHWSDHEGHSNASLAMLPMPTPVTTRKGRRRSGPSPGARFKRWIVALYRDTDRPKKIDVVSRVLFPAGFLLFNCVYWYMY